MDEDDQVYASYLQAYSISVTGGVVPSRVQTLREAAAAAIGAWHGRVHADVAVNIQPKEKLLESVAKLVGGGVK